MLGLLAVWQQLPSTEMPRQLTIVYVCVCVCVCVALQACADSGYANQVDAVAAAVEAAAAAAAAAGQGINTTAAAAEAPQSQQKAAALKYESAAAATPAERCSPASSTHSEQCGVDDHTTGQAADTLNQALTTYCQVGMDRTSWIVWCVVGLLSCSAQPNECAQSPHSFPHTHSLCLAHWSTHRTTHAG